MEFLNYRVDLTLTNGAKPTGVIKHVDSSLISLEDVLQNSERIPSIQIFSKDIVDLKVVQLPPDMSKNKRKKESKKGNDILLDEAIVFAAQPLSVNSTPQASVKNDDWSNKGLEEEFDFAANLAMFDKKSVFAEIQKNDTVSLQNRLVGHNKVDNVKKSKKEKYDNDEMVLDGSKADKWESIGQRFKRLDSNVSSGNNSFTNIVKEVTPSKKSFSLVNSETGQPVPLATPVQLLDIDRASDDIGIGASIRNEIFASNLLTTIVKDILGGSTRLSNRKNHNLPPLVLILVGSSGSSARALATGRHLANHGIRVLAYVITYDENDKQLLQQWDNFQAVGGKFIKSSAKDLFHTLEHDLDTPVELIIDALQGYDDHLDDLFYLDNDTEELKQIIDWCNAPHQKQKVMSLDIPSGIDGGSGTIVDSELSVVPKWVVSTGVPAFGLLHAYKNGSLSEEEEISHYLVDTGIPNGAYSTKGNLRKFDKLWFVAESVIKLDVKS